MVTAVQEAIGFALYHLGYKPGAFLGQSKTVDPSDDRTTEGHGPMQDTLQRVGRGKHQTIVIVCPNESCGWQGFYTRVVSLPASERMYGLQARNSALGAQIRIRMGGNATDLLSRSVASTTYADRMEYERNAQEVGRLQALIRSEGSQASAGFKFDGPHAGSLVIVPAAQAPVPAPTSTFTLISSPSVSTTSSPSITSNIPPDSALATKKPPTDAQMRARAAGAERLRQARARRRPAKANAGG